MKTFHHLKKLGVVSIFALLLSACSVGQKQETVGEYVDGSVITANVKAALVESEDTSAGNINVKTINGDTVQLSGFVKSNFEKARAEEIARSVKRVNNVHNDLVVKP